MTVALYTPLAGLDFEFTETANPSNRCTTRHRGEIDRERLPRSGSDQSEFVLEFALREG